MTSFRLFGTLEVVSGTHTLRDRDFGGRKPKQLLEILLLHEGRFVAKDQLADMLWGDKLPANFASTIEHYVSLVRKRLCPGGRPQESLLMTGHGGYRIDTSRAWIDIVAFTELADRASGLQQIEQALALVQGEVVEDEPYADWAIKARGYYAQRHQRLLVSGAEAALAGGAYGRAAELATSVIRADALAEDAYRLLMTAHYGSGNQQEALVAYRTCERVLGDEGLEPMRETAALREAILARAPFGALLPPPAPAPVPVTAPAALTEAPQQADGLPFLGRDAELAQLAALCAGTAGPMPGMAVAIVEGERGSGKSRLLDEVAAGVQGRPVVRIRCSALEAELPGALLGDVVRGLAADPSVATMILDSFAAPDWSTSGARALVLEAMSSLLRRRPYVLMIDDAQWADPESVAILASAARRCAGPGAGVLLFAGTHPLLSHVDAVARLVLRPLTASDLAGIGGADLAEHTGGLPLLVSAWHDSPSALRELVLRRCQNLGRELLRTASVAAWLPQPCGPEELARVLDTEPLPAVDQLERLVEIGMLRPAGRGFEFRYPAVRETLAGTVSAARQRVLADLVRPAESAADRRAAAAAVFPAARERRDSAGDRRGRQRRIRTLAPRHITAASA